MRCKILVEVVAVAAAVGLLSGTTRAANKTWSGNIDANWNTGGNWGGTAPVTNDNLIFGAAGSSGTNLTNNIVAATLFTGITFNNSASSFVISGNSITLGGGITLGTGITAEIINLQILLSGSYTYTVNSGSLTLGGVISGAQGMTKAGIGTLVLAAANYTGSTAVNSGTLVICAPASAMSGALTVGSSYFGGSFICDNVGAVGATSMTLASLTAPNMLATDNTVQVMRTVAQDVTLTFNSAINNGSTENGHTVNFAVSGSGITNGTNVKIVFTGALGTLVGSGGSSYYNFTSYNAYFNGSDFAVYDPAGYVRGIKYASDFGAATTVSGPFTAALNQEMTGNVSGQGSYTLGDGSCLGTLKINGACNLTMTAGSTLTFNCGGNVGVHGLLKTGGGSATISGGSAVNIGSTQGDFRVDGSTDVLNIAMPVSWSGPTRLMMSGAGTLILSSGTLQFTDSRNTLYVNGGVFEVGGNAVYNGTAANALKLANGTVFRYNSTSALSVRSGSIDGLGGVTVSAGTLTLSGANTFTGQLTVDGGTLAVGTINEANSSGPLGQCASAVILGKSGGVPGTLQYTNAASVSSARLFAIADGGVGAFQVDNTNTTLTLTSAISGGGGITKTGPGTLVLSATNTYTGDTRVDEGTLSITNIWLSDSGSVYIATSAKLNLNYAGTDTIGYLYLGGTRQPQGFYDYTVTPLLGGSGMLKVTKGPASGTVVVIR